MQSPQDNRTNELLERIAIALEKNTANVVYNGELKNTKDIPGFEGTLDALDVLCDIKTITDEYSQSNEALIARHKNKLSSEFSNKELHEQKLHTDEGEQEDDTIHNDYLNEIVEDMNHIEYLGFCHEMGYVSNDATIVTININELEYEECLGAIKKALFITGEYDIEERIGKDIGIKVEFDKDEPTSSNPDPYSYDNNLRELYCGVVNDSDFNIRKTADSYQAALDCETHFTSKKECIMDYITNEFGILGARYTDIIKFAYYLGAPNNPKYTNANRGYYSCAFSPRMNGHLIQGGKDYLVKGINKEGDERYFSYMFVDQATDYWKYITAIH